MCDPNEFAPSPDLFPFRSRWLEVGVRPSALGDVGSATPDSGLRGGEPGAVRARLHYIDEGEGPPLLLLHGNPTWSFLYRGLVSRLSDRFRCVAVDYPGFGLSERPAGYGYTPAEHARAVGALVRALDLEGVIIVGQDWGGPIGIACALDEPERYRGFAFGNTWCWRTDRRLVRAFARLASTRAGRWAILERNWFVEKGIPAGTATRLPGSVMAHYRGVQPTPSVRRGIAEFPRQLLAAGDWLAGLEARVPVVLGDRRLLLVWGMRDPAFPPTPLIDRWRGLFREVDVVRLPHAKHFIQEDAPDTMATAIRTRFAPDRGVPDPDGGVPDADAGPPEAHGGGRTPGRDPPTSTATPGAAAG